MQERSHIIRKMEEEDLPGAMRLKEEVGWNQTVTDWQFMLSDPHNHCLVAEREGRVAGTAVVVAYGSRLYWIGMVLVDKSCRGMGIGKHLMTTLTGRLGRGAVIKLDATPDGRRLYEKMGFRGEYEILRMANPAVEVSPAVEEGAVVRAGAEDAAAVVRYDREVFGADRAGLIRYLLTSFPSQAWLLRQEGRPAGFLLGREGSHSYQAGPLAASSVAAAQQLLEKALASLSGRAVIVDVPEQQETLIRWLEERGFVRQRSFLRMYLGTNIFSPKQDQQYLISGPEYG